MSLKAAFQSLFSPRSPSTADVHAFRDAASKGNVKQLRRSLKKFGADMLGTNPIGALYDAISAGHTDCAIALLEASVPVEGHTESHTSPLMTAANLGHADIVQELIARKANLNRQDANGYTALTHAAHHSRTNCIQLLVDAGADVDIETTFKTTPLFIAALSDCVEGLKILRKAGANINHRCAKMRTPLMAAAGNGSDACLTALIDMKAEIGLHDTEFKTALHWAKNTFCIHALLAAGELPHERDDKGFTPLHLSVQAGDTERVKAFIDHGTEEIDTPDNIGNTPAITAAILRTPDCLALLLDAKADINLQNNLGNTALMTSIICINYNMTKKLLLANADITLRNKAGRNALDLSFENDAPNTINLMKEAHFALQRKNEQDILNFSNGTTQAIDVKNANLKLRKRRGGYQ